MRKPILPESRCRFSPDYRTPSAHVNCALCGAPDTDDGGLCPACERLSSFFTRTLDPVRDPTGPLEGGKAHAFAPGHSFGERYTIVELVGAGGMGQVYKALDKRLN